MVSLTAIIAVSLFCFFKHCSNAIHSSNAPLDTQKTRINFGSCIFPTHDKSILSLIANRNPDLFIIMGDLTYIDYIHSSMNSTLTIMKGHFFNPAHTPDINEWQSVYDMVIKDPNWKYLNSKTEIIGVWDDHDYGQNDGDFTNENRDYAQNMFLNNLMVDQNDVRRNRAGTYFYYPFIVNKDIIIDIVLLDVRYFAKEDGAQNILGEQQWKWFRSILENKLNNNLLIIVSGIRIASKSLTLTYESWQRFNASQIRLFEYLMEDAMLDQNVLLLSGDFHRGQMTHLYCVTDERNGKRNFVGKNIFEVSSSPLTAQSLADYPMFIRLLLKFSHVMDMDGTNECLFFGSNFGEINIGLDSGNKKIIDVAIDIFDKNGVKQCSMSLPLFDRHFVENGSKFLSGKYAEMVKMPNGKCFGGQRLYSKFEIKFWGMIFTSIYWLVPTAVVLVPVMSVYFIIWSICKWKNGRKSMAEKKKR